ncbi:P-loop containing nucleoside triphosphate hydrolase protein [Aspergillus welwitschiae]|uniref:P-loop containing nucleoside triphosphate hydrolase protein n=1 Tax=Aspergillus welwitschiae TaxID=1341132 RepID=A0A3F3PHJ7_9EURO|nr:P-loop containing nucleoside triphosphate hydrolase protein [Aspergillus welwitschiae]RDH26389.1 P-loop containing nucleoside triphosphate hydrolase protein [Aspergillus welwitschiae]
MEIPSYDNLYRSAIRWTTRQPTLSKTDQFVVFTKASFSSPWDDGDINNDQYDDDPNDIFDDERLFEHNPREYWFKRRCRDAHGGLKSTPSQGPIHWFRYRGHDVGFQRRVSKESSGVLDDIMHDIRETPVKKNPRDITVYTGLSQPLSWVPMATKSPRFLSSVALDQEVKMDIVKDVTEFFDPRTEPFYKERGIPYRRGVALYGPPGTGKSSLCHAIASMLCMDIYTLSLGSSGLNDNTLSALFQKCPERSIVLLEDIDAASVPKRGGDISSQSSQEATEGVENAETHNTGSEQGNISLSGLLNVIDGVAAKEGRLLFITTNHIDRLDPALWRAGRVDMKAFIGYANDLMARELFYKLYLQFMAVRQENGTIQPLSEPVSDEWEPNDLDRLANQFASNIPPGWFSPASLEGYLLRHKNDPVSAACSVKEWVDQKISSFKIGHGQDLSSLRVSGSPCQFRLHGETLSISVGAVIFDAANGSGELRVLLLQRASHWELPGGTVGSTDSTIYAALKRKILEKSGLELSRINHELEIRAQTRNKEEKCPRGFPDEPPLGRKCDQSVRINAEKHQGFTWATEDEKATILEAFAATPRSSLWQS